jgi:hypothetical protein
MNNKHLPIIATRHLAFSSIGEKARHDLIIRIYAPYQLKDGDVPYSVEGGVAGCEVEFDGLSGETRTVHGADTVQALEMAVDIEPTLRRLSRKYTFFWLSGEPYFEE